MRYYFRYKVWLFRQVVLKSIPFMEYYFKKYYNVSAWKHILIFGKKHAVYFHFSPSVYTKHDCGESIAVLRISHIQHNERTCYHSAIDALIFRCFLKSLPESFEWMAMNHFWFVTDNCHRKIIYYRTNSIVEFKESKFLKKTLYCNR